MFFVANFAFRLERRKMSNLEDRESYQAGKETAGQAGYKSKTQLILGIGIALCIIIAVSGKSFFV